MYEGPLTLTPIAEHLAVELSIPVFTRQVCRGWEFKHPTFRLRVECSSPLGHHHEENDYANDKDNNRKWNKKMRKSDTEPSVQVSQSEQFTDRKRDKHIHVSQITIDQKNVMSGD